MRCELCGMVVYSLPKLFLKSNITTKSIFDGHEGHKCDSCGKTFNTLKNLERHLHTIHDGF